MPSKKTKAELGRSKKSKKDSKQPPPETKESQDNSMSQLLGITIAAINATKDLVPIDLAKGILRTIANILTIAQPYVYTAIVDKCETIREILESATKEATEDDLRGHLGHALTQLNKSVNRINSDFEAIAGMGIDMKFVKKALELMGNVPSINAPKHRQIEPPSRPAMLYGRDNLVAELTNLVVNDEHLALIGPGGMGKSSVAKAIINEPLVMAKFADRRFFISTFLRSASALVILNNAETFEEANTSSALGEIPPAISEMANIPGIILVLTSRSRRNALNHANSSEAEGDIKGLLEELDFHPLSISILANAAQQNGWSPATLLKRWNDRHSKVLDVGKGKLQSLSDTMQLSLSSPSIQNLGKDGCRVLAIIAFLPQGLNEDLTSDLLPSFPQVDTICDALCMQSLVYRQDNFIKVLAPIRHYVRDSLQPPDSACLQEIHAFYSRTVNSCSKERDQYADIIISDHLNIEHVVAFSLANIPDDAEETYIACWQFLECLEWHLPRPTTLTPAISNIVENSSSWMLKARCLAGLAQLYGTLSQLVEGIAGLSNSRGTLPHLPATLRAWGISQNLLEDLQHSDSWESISETTKARAWNFLDTARMHTFTVSADELFVKFAEDHVWGLDSKIWHWRAKFCHGGDAVQVHTHLEDLFLQCTSVGNVFNRRDALEGLADIAFCESRLSDAMDNLQTLVGIFEGQHSDDALRAIVGKAVVASKQGNCDLARKLVQKASESFPFFARSYGSACIELTAGECDRAETYFTTIIEACDMQSNLLLKACSIRGLGEIAFARSNFALAMQRFEETRSFCLPLYTLPDKFKGWSLFLEGQSPFANDTT
ncbi:hypothetical protein F4604DRAFT_1677564 [Suillus subluteus]|nr:hypothetical protein F4604DRAFT_1677564 [Suillus subluteus]